MEKLKYLPVLMYHHIIDKKTAKIWNNFCIEITQFEKQMDVLVKEGYNSLNFEDLESIEKGEKKSPKKPVIITIDDAYKETIDNVVPILAFRNIKCVFSVVTNFIGKQSVWEKGNPSYPIVTKDQLIKYTSALVSFESHTARHVHLTNHSVKEVEMDLADSKAVLESITGKKVRAVFYPYGSYNDNVKIFAEKAGYKFGVAVGASKKTVTEDPFEIRRVFVKPSDTLFAFKRKIAPWYIWFRGLRESYREDRRRQNE